MFFASLLISSVIWCWLLVSEKFVNFLVTSTNFGVSYKISLLSSSDKRLISQTPFHTLWRCRRSISAIHVNNALPCWRWNRGNSDKINAMAKCWTDFSSRMIFMLCSVGWPLVVFNLLDKINKFKLFSHRGGNPN